MIFLCISMLYLKIIGIATNTIMNIISSMMDLKNAYNTVNDE